MVDIARPQTRLDMADRNLPVIGRQSPRHHRGGIALHHDPVGLLHIEDAADPGEGAGGQLVKRLARRHQVEIVIGRDIGDRQHLIEHSAMLCGNAGARDEAIVTLQRVDQREELDRFGPCAENGEDFGRHGRSL